MGRASGERFLGRLDGRVGVGHGGVPHVLCTVDVALARRGSGTGAAILGTLSNPSAAREPFLACTEDGRQVRPTTVVVNQTALSTPTMMVLHRGSVQYGVAWAVLEATPLGLLSDYLKGEVIILAAVYLHPSVVADPRSDLGEHVFALAHDAMGAALTAATNGLPFAAVIPPHVARAAATR